MSRFFFGYITALVIALSVLVSGNVLAEPLDNWHWKNPLPQGNTLRSVIHEAGKYVAVGDYGTILTSDDGVAWNKWSFLNGGAPTTTANLKAVAYDSINARYAAVGDNATIIISSDGQTWTQAQTTSTTDFVGLAYNRNDNCFLALGFDGTLIKLIWNGSRYELTYLAGLSPHNKKNFLTLSYGVINSTPYFMAAGYHGAIFASKDSGATWSEVDVASQIPTLNTIKSSVFDGAKFVLLSEDGAIFTTSDGITLDSSYKSPLALKSPGTGVFNTLSFSGGTYLVAGNYNAVVTFDQKAVLNIIGDAGSQITNGTLSGLSSYNSDNGLLYWDIAIVETDTFLRLYKQSTKTYLDLVAEGKVGTDKGGDVALAAMNGSGLTGTITLIAKTVADTDAANKLVWITSHIYYSPDLATWRTPTVVQSGPANIYAGVSGTTAGSDFFLIGQNGQVLKTIDGGDNWNISGYSDNLNKALLHGVAFHNNEFYALGGSDLLETIYKIGSQTLIARSGNRQFYSAGITGANNTFFVAGSGGVSNSDNNGVTWSDPAGGSDLNGITFGIDRLIAVGASGAITSLDNGKIWSNSTSGDLNAVTFGNKTFVAVGKDTTSAGLIKTSTDGRNWTSRSSNTTNWLKGVAYGNGIFVAVGLSGTVLTSKDGATWTPVAINTTAELRGIAFGNGYFVAVGEEAGRGTILSSSDNGNTWVARPSSSENGFYGVSYGNNLFYAVGASGTILHSDPVYAPAPVTIVSTSPGNNATNVSPDLALVTVTFSLGMNAADINFPATNFTLTNVATSTGIVPTSVSYDPATYQAMLNIPASALAENTSYKATLTTAIKDGAGRAIPETSWIFSTGKRADTTPPEILDESISPAARATNVAVNSKIIITFSEMIDPATVTSASFGVVDNNNAAVAGEFTVSGATVTFTPGTVIKPVNLNNSTTYNVHITNAITDVSGNHLVVPQGWAFTTAAPNYSLVVSSGTNGSLTVYNKAGDDAVTPQLHNIALSGINALNSDSGKLYWKLALVGGTDYTVSLYKDAAATNLVAGGSISTANGMVSLLAKNGSGITGSVMITYVADDLTTGANILTVDCVPAGTKDLVITFNGNREVTITPMIGYDLLTFTDGGESVTDLVRLRGLSYSLTNVISDHTIAATFAVDVTPPSIDLSNSIPRNGAVNVPAALPVIIKFSEPINASTITNANIFVKMTSNGNLVPGVVTYDDTTNSAIFNATGGFRTGTVAYDIYITTGIKDTSNNALANGSKISFTTAALWNVTATTDGNGSVTPVGSQSAVAGAPYSITITPNTGYILRSITDGVAIPAASMPVQQADGTYIYTIAAADMTKDHTIAITFVLKSLVNVHSVQLTTGANGSVTSNPSDLSKVPDGSTVIFTITPDAGSASTPTYKLAGITADGTALPSLPALNADGRTYTYTLTNILKDQKIAVSFAKAQYLVMAISNANGNITTLDIGGTGVASVTDGDSITLSLRPKSGYFLTDVTDNGIPLNLKTSDLNNYIKIVSANADGTYTWTYTISNVKTDRNIIATFANQCIISVISEGGGTLSPGSMVAGYGSSKLFTIVPNTGYKFSSLTVNGVTAPLTDVANSTYLLTNITTNVRINAEFSAYPYQLNIVPPYAGTGTVNPAGSVYLSSGETKAVEINPAIGYALASITFNGTDVTPENIPAGKYIYTTPPVTMNSELKVVFKLIPIPDGDINLDGKLDIADVLLALQISVGIRSATPGDLSHGDVGPINAKMKPVPDGKIDIDDVVVLLQRVVGNLPAW